VLLIVELYQMVKYARAGPSGQPAKARGKDPVLEPSGATP